jgi:hypothetical protein
MCRELSCSLVSATLVDTAVVVVSSQPPTLRNSKVTRAHRRYTSFEGSDETTWQMWKTTTITESKIKKRSQTLHNSLFP